jgi:hypothetical protein
VKEVENELSRMMERLAREHDVVPFLDRRLGPPEMSFKPLPTDWGDCSPAQLTTPAQRRGKFRYGCK